MQLVYVCEYIYAYIVYTYMYKYDYIYIFYIIYVYNIWYVLYVCTYILKSIMCQESLTYIHKNHT